MRIPCPYCGSRDSQEFVYRGDASKQRPLVEPSDEAADAAFFDYVYLRENPAGVLAEHWYHAQGCRNWIVVERDTRSHTVIAATMAAGGDL
ncbi:sarcosine oxidase delta subunit heterotetrameric [Novosphingobium sp. Rr 2-17]|uniref:sarcosine oxidase subunit delta n=1 Tax=Novosphingobium sp. Rr 2-17 TaxID=555793 RepID=UPI0002699536|nr:sarcosine oxidase subunit delta [Novosphingobium sp. Rr 2-17]EIZ79205.1 sarcosine oxidase delta subunit heterotetrameric [Novosphingobium sp. Rr 2-17]